MASTQCRGAVFYIKKAHVDVIPGIQEYVTEFTSEARWRGYLSNKGLIPLPPAQRKQIAANASAARLWLRNQPVLPLLPATVVSARRGRHFTLG